MPHTLVTGANSFVAAHMINALVKAGHHVTGTVRKAASGDDVLALHPEWKSHLDFVVVEDITDEKSWEEASFNLAARLMHGHAMLGAARRRECLLG